MSLDTVLKIGNILRNSEKKMNFSNAVASCPKDKKGQYPFCLSIPVDKDYNINFDDVSIVPENQRNNLYYLKYKTSDNDTSCKYIYGDIYYSVKGTLEKKGSIKEPKEEGNYQLRKNSFNIGSAKYKSICSSSDNSPEEINEFQQIRIGIAKEQALIERILKYAPAVIRYFENEKGSFKDYIEDEENLKNICCSINKEKNKKKIEELFTGKDVENEEEYKDFLLRLNSASIFLHFSYEADKGRKKSWYNFSRTLELINREMRKEYVETEKDKFVLKKSLWTTICSGDKKNDIQFPNFDLKNKYKTRVFTESEIEDLFYGVKYAENVETIYGSEYKLIVLPRGNNLKAKDLISFQEKKNDFSIVLSNEYNNDQNTLNSGDSSTFTSFDFIFTRKTKSNHTYLMEISNITQSYLNRVTSRIRKKAYQVFSGRNKKIEVDLSLTICCKSFSNLLGNVQLDSKGEIQIAASEKYKSHILKTLPLVYKGDYYNDPSLLHSFVANVESTIRIGGGRYWYEILKYDLMFILSIQNNKQNKFMEISNSTNFKLGVKIGKLAKPLKNAIGSFEKNSVGLLSRRVSTKEDCVRFVTDICQKLVMHDRIWATMCAEVCEDLANLSEAEYDKDELSFGFLDGYFKYEPTDKKKKILNRLEKILADYSNNEEMEEYISKLSSIVDEIKNND